MRHRGFIVIAEAVGHVTEDGNELPRDVDVVEQPDGGANALNVNRCGCTLFLPTFAETQDLLSLTVNQPRCRLLYSQLVVNWSFIVYETNTHRILELVQPPNPTP